MPGVQQIDQAADKEEPCSGDEVMVPMRFPLDEECKEEEEIGSDWHPIKGIGLKECDDGARCRPIAYSPDIEGIWSQAEERYSENGSLM